MFKNYLHFLLKCLECLGFLQRIMSRVCQISGKRPSAGQNRSKACNATKRRFLPNLVTKRVKDPATGRMKRMRVSTSALRTMTKNSR
jgi:large subunit ribosomal protein L28